MGGSESTLWLNAKPKERWIRDWGRLSTGRSKQSRKVIWVGEGGRFCKRRTLFNLVGECW